MLPLCFCAFFPSVSDWWQVVLFLCSSLPPDAVLTWVPSPGPSNHVLFSFSLSLDLRMKNIFFVPFCLMDFCQIKIHVYTCICVYHRALKKKKIHIRRYMCFCHLHARKEANNNCVCPCMHVGVLDVREKANRCRHMRAPVYVRNRL